MVSCWRRGLFHQTWHPSFEEVMLYLDGELGPRTDRVGTHLKSCWSCRFRGEKIGRVISAFMETRNAALAGSPKFPTQALSNFEEKLDRLDSESGSPPFFSGLIRTQVKGLFLAWPPLRVAAFLVSLFVIGFAIIRLNSVPPVSAKEVLHRVKRVETQQMLQVPAPVIYEKLQLRRHSSTRRSETVTWEIWNDMRNSRLRQRVEDTGGLRFLPVDIYGSPAAQGWFDKEGNRDSLSPLVGSAQVRVSLPPVLAELKEVFQSNQADFGRPLSQANYEAWRRCIPDKSEEVVETKLPNGDKALILRASGQGPFLPNAIVNAEFMVRTEDWHPVEQRLQVQKEDGIVNYELGEVAFDVVALNVLPPSIFADLTPSLPLPLTVTPRPLVASRLLLPDPAELTAAEIEAWYALHSVHACLGRPISVVQVDLSRIEVHGVVETEERKTQLLATLRGIPHVTPKIRTVAEDWVMTSSSEVPGMEKENGVSSSDPDQPGLGEAQNRKLVIEDLLEQYFADRGCAQERDDGKRECVQQKIAELSHQVVSRSESAQEQAWALRRLAQWYPWLKQGELRTSSRRLLELMVRDHITALKEELDRSRALVEPVLSSLLPNAAESNEGHPLTRPAATLSPTGGEGVNNRITAPLAPIGGDGLGVREGPIGEESIYSNADKEGTEPPSSPDLEKSDWAAASLHLCASVERAVSLTLGMFAETNLPVTQREEAMKDLLSTFATGDGKFQQLETQVATELSDSPKLMTSKTKPENE